MYSKSSREQDEVFHITYGSSRSLGSGKRKKSKRPKTTNQVGLYRKGSDSYMDEQSYLAIGSDEPADELRRALSMMMGTATSSTKSFTLPLKNNTPGELMKTFMACQNCSDVSTQSKQLQCSHTICQQCALALRTKHIDPGQWMLRCQVCNLITTWYGKHLEGLQDNVAVQKMIKQSNHNPNHNGIVKEKDGQITMYGEKDMTINIVSFSKEKAEIQKALKNAEGKIQKCQQQAKLINEYEKRINEAKSKLKRQAQHSADALVSAIRSQQAQISDDIDDMFKKDFKPVLNAKTTLDGQMHSLKLVTQCCSVANRILKSGGAPLDLDNFKRMVWQTMNKTNVETIPKAIQKNYKPSIFFKSNESQYDELAERIGELVVRKERKKKNSVSQEIHNQKLTKQISKTETQLLQKPPSEQPSSSDEGQIYDIPPELEAKLGLTTAENECEENIIYDEIPFSSEMFNDEDPDVHDLSNIPPPLPKNFMSDVQSEPPDLPPPPSSEIYARDQRTELPLTNPADLLDKRRQAINGTKSDYEESSSFSTDEDHEVSVYRPIPASRSRINSARSRTSGYRSARESRSRPASPTTGQRLKSFGGGQDYGDESYFEGGESQYTSWANGYDTQPEFHSEGTISRLMRRRKSMKSLGTLSSQFQQWLGTAERTPMGLNSEKLLFCVGKIKKPGSEGNVVQPFNNPPEFAVSEDDTIWIADNANARIQIHEGVNGRVVGSFKTVLHGVALKARGITTLANGRQVAISCGRFTTVWSEGGELVRQVGPHSDFGKLGGLNKDMNGNLILSDIEYGRIVLTGTGKIIYNAVFGMSNSTKSPWVGRIAINEFDQVICPDYGNHCIRIYSSAGHPVAKFGGFGVGPRQFRYPSAVAVDGHNRIYVADECNNRISIFTGDGEEWLGHVITKDDGLAFPHAVSVFSDGAIAVADDSKVVKVYRTPE